MKRDIEVVRGMPMADYLKIPAASSSRLRTLGEYSPAHMKAEIEQPREDTDATRIGTAGHYAVIEPALLEERFAVGPTDDRRLKAWREFADECDERGVAPLRPKDMDAVNALRDAVMAHKAARHLIEQATDRELTVLWLDGDTEVTCKARIDLLVPEYATTVELKTTRDARLSKFEKSVWDYGYHTQGAWYLRAANAMQSDVQYCNHAIIAVENGEPYPGVNVFYVRPEIIDLAAADIDRWLKDYAKCWKADEWPCESNEYSSGARDIAVPVWAQRKLEERNAA